MGVFEWFRTGRHVHNLCLTRTETCLAAIFAKVGITVGYRGTMSVTEAFKIFPSDDIFDFLFLHCKAFADYPSLNTSVTAIDLLNANTDRFGGLSTILHNFLFDKPEINLRNYHSEMVGGQVHRGGGLVNFTKADTLINQATLSIYRHPLQRTFLAMLVDCVGLGDKVTLIFDDGRRLYDIHPPSGWLVRPVQVVGKREFRFEFVHAQCGTTYGEAPRYPLDCCVCKNKRGGDSIDETAAAKRSW